MPPHLAWRWPVMRLVRRGVARLDEIRRSWTIHDVLDYNEVLDLEDDAELRVAEIRDAESRARMNHHG